MNRWSIYAGAATFLIGVSALIIYLFFDSEVRIGILAGLAVAWLVQLGAFGVLLSASRRDARGFLAGWMVGFVARLASVGAVAWWTLAGPLGVPAEPTLIALAVGFFALLLLEPAIYRWGREAS